MFVKAPSIKVKRVLRDSVYGSPLRPLLFPEPEFVIIGTGRSGTAFISRALTRAGVRTGHEDWWRIREGSPTAARLMGDASWAAAFNLDGYTGRVFHQVRDPIKVVNSLFCDGVSRDRPALEARARHVTLTGDILIDSMNITVAWIEQCEAIAEWTWRLEDVDARLLGMICERTGHPISSLRAEHALAVGPAGFNRHTSVQRVGWEDIPSSELKAAAQAIAHRYGYL